MKLSMKTTSGSGSSSSLGSNLLVASANAHGSHGKCDKFNDAHVLDMAFNDDEKEEEESDEEEADEDWDDQDETDG